MSEDIVSSSDALPTGQAPTPNLDQLASNLLLAPPAPAEGLSEEEKLEIEQIQKDDAIAFAGPESITAYNFGQPPPGVPQSRDQELVMRSLFQAEGLPVSIGNEIGRLYNKAAANPPTPTQLEVGRQTGMLAIQKLWGSDTEKNLAVAKAEIQRMAQREPGILPMLHASGLINNPWLAATLYNVAKAKGRAR